MSIARKLLHKNVPSKIVYPWATVPSTVDSNMMLRIDGSGNIIICAGYTCRIDPASGAVTPIGTVMAPGGSPYMFALSGTYLVWVWTITNKCSYMTNYPGPVNGYSAGGVTGLAVAPTWLETSPSGQVFALCGTKVAKITSPNVVVNNWATLATSSDICRFDAAGNMFAVSMATGIVTKISPAGVVTDSWATAGVAVKKECVIDSSGNIYLLASATNTLIKIDSAGVVTNPFATLSAGTTHLGVDSSGNIYAVHNTGLDKVTPAGAATLNWWVRTSIPAIAGANAQNFIIDASDNIYITFSNKNLVKIGA